MTLILIGWSFNIRSSLIGVAFTPFRTNQFSFNAIAFLGIILTSGPSPGVAADNLGAQEFVAFC
jgi:hypothetical protein